MEKKALLGAHISFRHEDQLLGSIKDLLLIGATSGALYISDSRGYRKSFLISEEKSLAGKELAKENGFNIENIIVHAPMVGNLANIEKEKDTWALTVQSYIADLKRLKAAGLKYYNFHPGSAVDQDLGIKQCARGINQMHKETQGDKTIVLIETMMKKGNYIGKNFAQIAEIISLIEDKSRIGVCFDTCHVWDGGYDIKNDLPGVLDEFDKVIGLKYLLGLHINDSKNELGSGKDRHELIGKGYIGLKALHAVVNHPILRNLPKALETPYGKDDFRKWSREIKMLTN